MAKFLKSVLLFSVLCGVSYFVIVIAWAHLVTNPDLKRNIPYRINDKLYLQSRMLEADTTRNVDVLFLGSSHAYRGFDTRLWEAKGIRSFNLGSSSQSPLQTSMVVDRYLDGLAPKVVVFEVYPAAFQSDGVESALDFVANDQLSWETVNMVRKVNHIKPWNALIYDCFREAFHLNDSVKGGKLAEDSYVPGGFVETTIDTNRNPVTATLKKRWNRTAWTIRDKQLRAFASIIDVLNERNIEVWLVQMPVTRPAFNHYENNAAIDSLLMPHGRYVNLNYTLRMDDHFDFKDYHHLNQRGVEKANAALIDLMMRESPYLSNHIAP